MPNETSELLGTDSGLEKLFAFLMKGLDGSLTLPSCLRYEYDVWSCSSPFGDNMHKEKAKRIEELLAEGFTGSQTKTRPDPIRLNVL